MVWSQNKKSKSHYDLDAVLKRITAFMFRFYTGGTYGSNLLQKNTLRKQVLKNIVNIFCLGEGKKHLACHWNRNSMEYFRVEMNSIFIDGN